MSLRCTWLGRAPYREVWALQERARADLLAGAPDAAETVFLVEHEPVITLGRSAAPANLRVPRAEILARGIDVVDTSRGGDVTAHGPGQLVVYPVVRLTRGVLAHVVDTGNAIAAELRARGVAGAEFRRDPVGVFVGAAKIAACGVHVSRRVAIHGWAINVTPAVRSLFTLIVPCGLTDVPITTLEDELGAPAPPIETLATAIAARIVEAIGRSTDRSTGSADSER